MISTLPIPKWSQRNPGWSGQRLGTQGSNVTIGQSGCLITSIAMMNAGFDPSNQLNPAQIDNLFSDNGGYANSNLIVWNSINRLLPNCNLNRQAFCTNSPAPIEDIRGHLDGGGLCIVQVGFGGNASNMHYLLVVGYNGSDIMFFDPWYGDGSSFATSRRYGTGDSSKDILAVHFFSDAIPPVKADVPVAARPIEQPLLGYQREVRPGVNVNYRRSSEVKDDNSIRLFKAGDTLDFQGFVHGQEVEGNDVWFVGRYSNGFAFSGAFTDPGVHDLADITPEPPPTPTPPVEAPVPMPVDNPAAVTVVPVPGSVIDGVQPPTPALTSVFEDLEPIPGQPTQINETTAADLWKKGLEILTGILLTPLRLLKRGNKK